MPPSMSLYLIFFAVVRKEITVLALGIWQVLSGNTAGRGVWVPCAQTLPFGVLRSQDGLFVCGHWHPARSGF